MDLVFLGWDSDIGKEETVCKSAKLTYMPIVLTLLAAIVCWFGM